MKSFCFAAIELWMQWRQWRRWRRSYRLCWKARLFGGWVIREEFEVDSAVLEVVGSFD